MGRISRRADLRAHKYQHDLWANEIMLLPYYVASGNIEHEYFEKMGEYLPFEGLCFQDTLDLSPADQLGMFAEANSERIAAPESRSKSLSSSAIRPTTSANKTKTMRTKTARIKAPKTSQAWTI